MITVDKIGHMRRAYFERHLPIKEIVRTLSVSRATVRKVIRGKATDEVSDATAPTRRMSRNSDQRSATRRNRATLRPDQT